MRPTSVRFLSSLREFLVTDVSPAPAAVALSHIKYIRGQDSVKTYGQSETIGAPRNGHTMTEHWCDHCGRLLYRVSSGLPDLAFVRAGAVDDLGLHESLLKPDSAFSIFFLSSRSADVEDGFC